jgi:hypothetical protein
MMLLTSTTGYVLEFEVKDSNDPSRPYSHSELHKESGSQE